MRNLQVTKSILNNGEYYIKLNDIIHWVKIAGVEHRTTPIVVIHGGPGGFNYNYERTIGPRLEAFYTIIYYEQRGCGRSEAPNDPDAYSISVLVDDLEALRLQLGLEKIIPLGYSFGGELALEYTIRYPYAVEKLIVEAPSSGDWNRSFYIQMYGFEAITEGDLKKEIRSIINEDASLENRCLKIWNMVDSETVDRFLFQNKEAAKLNRNLWRESGLKNTGLMAKVVFKQHQSILLQDRVSSIKVPVLIMIGLYDRNVGIEMTRDLANQVPYSQLVIFEYSSHFPNMEEPEKYAETIRVFLQ